MSALLQLASALLVSLCVVPVARAEQHAPADLSPRPSDRRPSDPRPSDESPALAACLAPTLARLSARGATAHVASTSFLVEGESRSTLATLATSGCVGFLAVGESQVRDLDLSLHTAAGTLLVEDTGSDAHPYVRFCGAAGLELALTVKIFGGQGEVRVVRIDDAPPSIDGLDALLGECIVALGGVRRASPELGAEPVGRSIDAALAAASLREAQLGRTPDGALTRTRLAEHENFARAVPLLADSCYAIAAVSGPEMRDLDLAVHDPDGALVGRDASRERDARVAFCTSIGGNYRLSARAHEGHGELGLQLFRVPENAGPRPAGLIGGARVRYAEQAARMRARGLRIAPLAWGQLAPGERLVMPLPIARGQCLAIGGVASDELDGADLDVLVEGDGGRLIAWHVGTGGLPLTYVCADRDERLRVVGRIVGPRVGRYLIVVGASAP